MASSLGGCVVSMGNWTEDVTNNPQFQTGYKPGQVFRLTEDAYIAASHVGTANETRALCSTAFLRNYPTRAPLHPSESARAALSDGNFESIDKTTLIPKGAIVRVDRLQYTYLALLIYISPAILDNPTVEAYGTISTPSAKWNHVILPIAEWGFWRSVPAHWPAASNGIAVPRGDRSYLELLSADAKVAAITR